MKLLLDTCILAELRSPTRNESTRKLIASFPDEGLFLSALTIGEIAKGVNLLPESKKKSELTSWLCGLQQHFSSRILPIDRDTALMWGELTARAQSEGIIIPVCDGLIAATALRYGLHVVTRNVKHFKGTGAFLLDIETTCSKES